MDATFDKKIFTAQIKKLRKEHNLTQDKFAERINCSVDTIKRWENSKDEAIPKLEHLIAVCNSFNTDLTSLVLGHEAFPPSAERISHEIGLSTNNVIKIRKLNRHDPYSEKLKVLNMVIDCDGILDQILYYMKYGTEISKVSCGSADLLLGKEANSVRINEYTSEVLLDGIKQFHLKELQKALDKAISIHYQT